ncbi:MAG: hypothetical protein KG003_07665 [Bacteroidetes bacterium]|nr:hypothetical protein [Bacteroidota bacterium]
MNTSQKLINKIRKYDFKGLNNEFRESIELSIAKAVGENKPINLISFTCSTINSEYLFSDTPWLYVSTNPKGNNLTSDAVRLKEIFDDLRDIYPKVELNILIGNTDPYYIYLQQFKKFPKPKDMLWQEFSTRWSAYKINFEKWMRASIPEVRIISWYEFEKETESKTGRFFEKEYEKVKQDIYSYFTKDQLEWEFRKLQTQFGKGNYFENLEKPDDAMLKDWIVRKFTEYAVQAKWIFENIPNAILIQNEKPSDLRSEMYQPVIKKEFGDSLPIVYFFGVDNSGYQ